jgi:hypothetical protein
MVMPTAEGRTSQVGCVQDAGGEWQISLVYNIRGFCLLGFYLLATAEPFEKAALCFPNLAMIVLQLHRRCCLDSNQACFGRAVDQLIRQAEQALSLFTR